MGIGLQAIPLSPCHAGLAEQQFQRLLSVLGFIGRLLSPRPFGFRLAVDPRISSESCPSAMGMLHVLLRRTGRWRQSARCPCWAMLLLVMTALPSARPPASSRTYGTTPSVTPACSLGRALTARPRSASPAPSRC